MLAVSNEAWRETLASNMISESMLRAIHRKGDEAFITAAPDDEDSVNLLTGVSRTEGIQQGEQITDSLDPLADLIGGIEAASGTPSIIIANPRAWSQLRKLKTAEGSHTALLGAGTSDAEKRLLGVEVVTSPAVTPGELLVIDRSAVAAAVGPVRVANSEHAAFHTDGTALRVTWRIGWSVVRPERLGKLSVYGVAAPPVEDDDEGTDSGE